MSNEQNNKDWMLTQTRRQVWPLALKHADVNVMDIAMSLGKQCRYNGHVDKFYTVAEHSVQISKALERDGFDHMTQFVGLHHDDSECWMGDQIKPLKNALEQLGVSLKPFELAIEKTVSERFGMPWPWPEIIHEYDRKIVRDEKEQLKAGGGDDWIGFNIPEKGIGVYLPCWTWEQATKEFLARHSELTERIWPSE
jgi:hypothetical protein